MSNLNDDRIRKIAEEVEKGNIKVDDLSVDDMFDLAKFLSDELNSINEQIDLCVANIEEN